MQVNAARNMALSHVTLVPGRTKDPHIVVIINFCLRDLRYVCDDAYCRGVHCKHCRQLPVPFLWATVFESLTTARTDCTSYPLHSMAHGYALAITSH